MSHQSFLQLVARECRSPAKIELRLTYTKLKRKRIRRTRSTGFQNRFEATLFQPRFQRQWSTLCISCRGDSGVMEAALTNYQILKLRAKIPQKISAPGTTHAIGSKELHASPFRSTGFLEHATSMPTPAAITARGTTAKHSLETHSRASRIFPFQSP